MNHHPNAIVWTEELLDSLFELALTGLPWHEIGAEVNVNKESARRGFYNRATTEQAELRKIAFEEYRQELREEREAGRVVNRDLLVGICFTDDPRAGRAPFRRMMHPGTWVATVATDGWA